MTSDALSCSAARAALVLLVAMTATPAAAVASSHHPAVHANDNRLAAGTRGDGTLTLRLRAGRGVWQPEGPAGPGLTIEAFGEKSGPLLVPAPLIRVPEGTTILASVQNQLATPLTVHGLCARDGSACPTLAVPPGQTRTLHFASGRAGTYHYWASSFGAPVPFREMAGAFVVDPAEGAEPDRVLVITEWSNLTPAELVEVMTADDPGETFVAKQPGVAFMLNGLSWPATERLQARVGEAERWRVVNLSSQPHPMHLHGFYFSVDSVGNGRTDAPATSSGGGQQVVTHLLPPGGTLAMTWLPERAGNWLFHCHLMEHVSPMRRLPRPDRPASAPAQPHATGRLEAAGPSAPHAHAAGPHDRHAAPDPHAAGGHGLHAPHDASLGMAGLVLGVTVTGPEPAPMPRGAAPAVAPRKITLTMRAAPTHDGGPPVTGVGLHQGDAASAGDRFSSPGPALVLRRGEPVEITLVNGLTEPTAIHWHGMELDSYYDGVHGWSGSGVRQTPIIAPGEWFVARFTPPRAGTFIYHTHLHDHRQLSSGLYGPMVVVEAGDTFDPATDHALVLGRSGITSGGLAIPNESTPIVLNGARAPRMVWAAGTRHRLRLVNITPDDILEVSLRGAAAPAEWTPVAKDASPVPGALGAPVPARQVIAVGETYDFEVVAPPGRRTWWLEVRTVGGKWQLQSQVIVR